MKKIIIAIDGPAGSGKSTTARRVAQELGYIYIDTGAMYRAATLAALRTQCAIDDASLATLLAEISIELKQSEEGQRTFLNRADVSDHIRLPEVTEQVSAISALPSVRRILVEQQQEMGHGGGVVMDGRDIGTVVFPQADLKIFLVASSEERARRRVQELLAKGIDIKAEEMEQQIIERDRKDSGREVSPLRKAEDAVEIDTSNITIEEQTAKVVELAKQKLDRLQ